MGASLLRLRSPGPRPISRRLAPLALVSALALPACRPSAPSDPGDTADPDGAMVADPRVGWRSGAAAGAATEPDPHAGIACSGCHSGGRADFGRASVPPTSCTAAGCHEDGGAQQVRLATATFEHRRHGEGGDVEPTCAGCHTHAAGDVPLRASVDACALCHLPQITSPSNEDCQVCHQRPQHVALTSAGVPVPHGGLPWPEVGCVRCHYDVADPPVEAAPERCSACHADVQAIARHGIGTDLHPRHAGVTCTGCHTAGTHHVRAISSAVSLVCADCHADAHGVPLVPWVARDVGWENNEVCNDCHRKAHGPQQQLLLGLLPEDRAMPSPKFLLGMTCRSCHIPPAGGPPIQPIRGQALACAACHPGSYQQVLDWWVDGLEERLRRTDAYLATARRQMGESAPDSARALLASATGLVDLVRAAGGQHNLELADRMIRESVRRAEGAYAAAELRRPATPDLGRRPHQGLCSGCHYAFGPWDIRAMPEGFHERLRLDRIPR